jgi:hypothetical protein
MTRLVKFWRLARRERESLGEALIFLSLANVCVRRINFKHIDRFLRAHWNDRAQRTVAPQQEIALVQRSISRAANILPWSSLCLSTSIAEFVMLRRRGISAALCAGVRSDRASLVAHAWVETGSAISDAGYATVIRIGPDTIDHFR